MFLLETFGLQRSDEPHAPCEGEGSPSGLRVLVVLLFGFSLPLVSQAQTYDVLKRFISVGAYPQGRLIQGTDGNLYGTTTGGGTGAVSCAQGCGTIFKIDTNGTTLTTLHNFAGSDGEYPGAGLIQATDGNLYGTTSGGVEGNNYGTVFKIDTNGTALTTLHSFAFSDGAYPYATLTQGTDGNLYGTTLGGGASGDGTIFKIDTNGITFTTLHNFAGNDGAGPWEGLMQAADGNLYGTTAGGGASGDGTIFKIDPNGTTFTTLHHFAYSDGAYPYAELIQGTDGNLYGTTYSGGTSVYGTIFRMDTDGTTLTTLHSFVGRPIDGEGPHAGLIQGSDGNLYGTTYDGGAGFYGTIFRIDTSGSTFATLHNFAYTDGAHIYAGLVQGMDGNLYGTAYDGGAGNLGTPFKIDTNGIALATLHNFANIDGTNPYGRLTQGTDGNLYGTTWQGGTLDGGTIFKIGADGTTFTTLHSFVGSDGSAPIGGLVQGTDGNLYGTTEGGADIEGTETFGTVFKIDTSGTTFDTLHYFAYVDGANPHAGLLQAADGSLYGTTYLGGASGYGTIFKIDTNGTALTTLHSFAGGDGSYPLGGLIQGTDGNLYGTTFAGGASGWGTIFKIDTNGATFATLYSFDYYPDGAAPYAGLVQGTDGNLYGTTGYGGTGQGCVLGCGTVFKIDTDGNTFTTLHNFVSSDAGSPHGALIQAADGTLYGTTYGGFLSGANIYGYGTVFKIDTNGSTLTTLHSFTGSDGVGPYAGLTQGTDGNFYGTATVGGMGGGVVFRLVLSGAAFQVTGVAPTSGSSSGGTTVSVAGLDFESTDAVSFGGLAATGASYVSPSQIDATTPGLTPGTLNDVVVTKLDFSSAQLPRAFFADFLDVPQGDIFHDYVEKIFRNGITAGCGGGSYCRDNPVRRDQMAVFLLKAEHGSSYLPPACNGVFPDVPCPSTFADWIERLFHEGITGGCGGGDYCPTNPVTRQQMAVFLLKTEHGSAYVPPACAGIFGDVPCPSPFADWIEQLFNEGITGGCGGGDYCPSNPVTRGQMAVFLVKTFGLQ